MRAAYQKKKQLLRVVCRVWVHQQGNNYPLIQLLLQKKLWQKKSNYCLMFKIISQGHTQHTTYDLIFYLELSQVITVAST